MPLLAHLFLDLALFLINQQAFPNIPTRFAYLTSLTSVFTSFLNSEVKVGSAISRQEKCNSSEKYHRMFPDLQVYQYTPVPNLTPIH